MDWKVGERFRRQRESGGKPHETTEKWGGKLSKQNWLAKKDHLA
jgi:hypothetical protein